MDMLAIPGFSEPVSSLSHLGGAVAFAILAIALLRRGVGDRTRTISLAVFAFSCVLLLGLSGVYHLLSPETAGRAVLKRLDHAAIFVLIAGSFTPVHAILFRGAWRWGMLTAVWGAALAGIVFKTVYFDSVPEWLGLTMYLGLGWFGIVSAAALARSYGWRSLRLVFWGALAYTAGAVVEFLRWPVLLAGILGPHEIFHLAVLAGIACHWMFIGGIALGEATWAGRASNRESEERVRRLNSI